MRPSDVPALIPWAVLFSVLAWISMYEAKSLHRNYSCLMEGGRGVLMLDLLGLLCFAAIIGICSGWLWRDAEAKKQLERYQRRLRGPRYE